MASRTKRATIAAETIKIIESGKYTDSSGQVVTIAAAIREMISGTFHYDPMSFDELFRQRNEILAKQTETTKTKYLVNNTTTFAAAKELLDKDASPVLCLNFASAKNPGGGFISGSQAQEECLARASGLYGSINRITKYYETNRHCGTSLYTHHMIYSPAVPVFRNDDDDLIDNPYEVSIITSPAVNRGAVCDHEPECLKEVESTMLDRIDRILAIAVVRGYRRLVLGAWGCGVFRNEPGDVARWFSKQLRSQVYQHAFDTVYFAVLDKTASLSTITPFRQFFCDEAFV
ncbi:MAG: TIGR02452 family protein [Pirellulales bacterium]